MPVTQRFQPRDDNVKVVLSNKKTPFAHKETKRALSSRGTTLIPSYSRRLSKCYNGHHPSEPTNICFQPGSSRATFFSASFPFFAVSIFAVSKDQVSAETSQPVGLLLCRSDTENTPPFQCFYSF